MMSTSHRLRGTFLAVSVLALLSAPVFAQHFDPAPLWPLCGHIAETPGWTLGQGCPSERWGKAEFNDFPLSDTFGPRARFTTSVYDFHRGIDIPAPIDTPVFAISAGTVDLVDADTVEIRHLRPGAASCADGGGCWFSRYQHIGASGLVQNGTVAKAQYLGTIKFTSSGFPHLHFEIRDATPDDPSSSWQRDAIHPLRVLPYIDDGAHAFTVEILSADVTNPFNPRLTTRITLAREELDLARVEVQVYEVQPDGSLVPIPQSGAALDAYGYFAHPPWIDFEQRCFLFSHKDNLSAPWSSFSTCPYAYEHPASYDPNVHVDQAGFDGIFVTPVLLDNQQTRQDLTFEFRYLDGSAGPLCFVVEAFDLYGQAARAALGCNAPQIFDNGFESGLTASWSSALP